MKSKSLKLYERWVKRDPILTKKVMSQDRCEIEPEFMCFEMYEPLSKMIPKHWTIFDIGCAFAPQCLYFKDHKRYVGVDPGELIRFMTPNTGILQSTVKEWIAEWDCPQGINFEESFAIMSYVPADEYSYFLVKTHFKNMFIYYPAGNDVKILSKNVSDLREMSK